MRLRNIPGAKDAIAESAYVIQSPEENAGKWHEVFKNGNPVHIEVGMGKGRFIMDMAAQNPHINYVGIEMYDSVLLRALQKMEERETETGAPENLFFMRMDARELPLVFNRGEVDRIYLNFSDPWPKERTVEFKTDNRDLFDFSVEEVKEAGWKLLACTYDLHHDGELNLGNVMTEYEEKFSSMGNPIHKLIAAR